MNESVFPTQISQSGGKDLQDYAGSYLVYYFATNARSKIIRGFLRIGDRDSGKNIYKRVLHYDERRLIEYEGFLLPLANNNLAFLLENVRRPDEVGFTMFKKITSTTYIPPHFVALSCYESMSIHNAHVPTAYRELFIRYDGDEPPDNLGQFDSETLGTVDPRNPEQDLFFLRKLKDDFFQDYPYLQVHPEKDRKRLGSGRYGYRDMEYTREIEFLVKASPESRAGDIVHILPWLLGSKLKAGGISGDVRVFRKNMDESVLTVSVSFIHESPRSFRTVCDLVREELAAGTERDGTSFHELLFTCRTHDGEREMYSAPCSEKAWLDIRSEASPGNSLESGGPEKRL